jgi:putative salt-induced outer membrane protein YdiY
MKLATLSALVFATLSANVLAEESKEWEVTSEVGAIITTGNTETTTLKGGIKAKHELESWSNEYKLSGIYKEDEIVDGDTKETRRTNEKYEASVQGNYKLNEKHSTLYASGSYSSDYFGAFRSEAVVSVGYGARFLKTPSMVLSAEIGPGYKYFEHQASDDPTDPKAGEFEGEAIAVGKIDFNWKVSDNARFTQTVKMEYGKSNTKTVSETALMTKVNGSLQMKVAYNITHNSEVNMDKENTDTETSLTMVYSF